jgi:hypothetical protein
MRVSVFFIRFVFVISGIFFLSNVAFAQGERQVIQFSGFIIGEDEKPVAGVYVYIPKAGRGTATNAIGFFTIPSLAGDSLVISAVGFQKQYVRIPQAALAENAYSVVIELREDVVQLPMVEVYPYPTEELFKQAFLALELPDDKEQAIVRRNLDQELLTRMMYESTTLDPQAGYRYYLNQQNFNTTNRNMFVANPLLNPFAWANFIKSVKRGDLKKKKWKDD